MSPREVVLGLKKNSIITLSYDDFDWERFKKRLKAMGLEVVSEDKIPCG